MAQLSTLGHIEHNKTMKTTFTILWTFASLLIGFVMLTIAAIIVIQISPHAHYPDAIVQHQNVLANFTACLFLVGLPILVMILGIRGKLPGTRSSRSL